MRSERAGEAVRAESRAFAADKPSAAAAPPVWLIPPGAGTAGISLVSRAQRDADANTPQEHFETLGQSDAARVYAARLCRREGAFLELALKAQRTDRGGGAQADARWARAIEALAGVGERPPGVPACFSPADDDVAPRIGPRLFCKFRRILFRPRSPVSKRPLVTCRDEALLKRRGPAAAEGELRFVYAPADADAASPPFYCDDDAGVGDAATGPFGVDQMLRDQGRVPAAHDALAEQDPRLHAELEGQHPCYACPEVPRCYPEKGYAKALDRLMVVAFHDFHALAWPRYDLQFDDYVDLLGGRPLEPWLEQLRHDALPYTAQQQRVLETLGGTRLFLFEDDAAARRVLEIVTLKWTAVTQVAAALHELVRAGRPHGRLSARHVLVRFPRPVAGSPLAWAIEVGLIGLDRSSEATAERTPPSAAAEPLYSPGVAEGRAGLSADLHALGVLALRALWVHAERDLPGALADARHLIAEGIAAAGADACRRVLQRPEWAWPNVLYGGSAVPERRIAAALEPPLARILALTLRLLVGESDSLPAGAGGEHERQVACMAALLDECTGIQRALESTLFTLPAEPSALRTALRFDSATAPSAEDTP